MSHRPIRVLHCPKGVGSHPQQLARAERELGLESTCVSLRETPLQEPADEILYAAGRPWYRAEYRRWLLFRRALRDFDVIHFNSGESLFPTHYSGVSLADFSESPRHSRLAYTAYGWYSRLFHLRDLPLLKRAGKAIVVTFQGSDARQADYCRTHLKVEPTSDSPPGRSTARWDRHKRRNIARFDRYADRIYSLNPDLLRVLPSRAEFLPYASVDPREWAAVPVKREGPLTVLHAPSRRDVKGTRFVLDAVDRLRREDKIDFEFVLVEGLPRQEAKRLYRRADLLIDQLLVGWYGGLALELMALGKPVICYLRESDLKHVPVQMRKEIPIIGARPDSIYDVLKTVLTGPRSRLVEMGEQCRNFAVRWHDPKSIAAGLKGIYQHILDGQNPS